jgi:Spy/CpxP family protein refolding chaperone
METNKSKNLILILLFIVLVINISMMVTFFLFPKKSESDKDYRKYRNQHPRENVNLVVQLELTNDQEEVFFKLRDEHKQHMREMFDSARIIRNSMIDALVAEPEKDAESLYVFAKQMGDIEFAIQKEAIDYFLKMKDILHKDQFLKLIENFRNVCGCKASKRYGPNSPHCSDQGKEQTHHRKN